MKASPIPHLSSYCSAIFSSLLFSIALITPQICLAYGLFLTADGPASGSQARLLITRTSDGIRIISQGKYKGDANTKAYWLIPTPNITDLEANPPRLQSIDSAPLDELSELTAPRFEGACEDEPNGDSSLEEISFKPGLVSSSKVLAFNAHKLAPPEGASEGTPSELEQYLIDHEITMTEELNDLLYWGLDQNLMFLLFEFEEGTLSDEVDPSVDIQLTISGSPALRVALKQLSLSIRGMPSDLIFWVLSQERYRANFPTRELDLNLVSFTSPETTDYLQQFDLVAQTQQSQIFITEYVGNITPTTFTDSLLATLRNEILGTQLTRLRSRLISAALRTNAESISFRTETGGTYDRSHRIQGFECAEEGGEEAGAQAGEEAGTQAGDEGEMNNNNGGMEMNPSEDEAGMEDQSGQGDDGCQSISSSRSPLSLPLPLILLCLTLFVWRRPSHFTL